MKKKKDEEISGGTGREAERGRRVKQGPRLFATAYPL